MALRYETDVLKSISIGDAINSCIANSNQPGFTLQAITRILGEVWAAQHFYLYANRALDSGLRNADNGVMEGMVDIWQII